MLNVAYVFGFNEIDELSKNLKLSFGVRSNLAVAGMLPSFFKLICWLLVLPTLVLGNFSKMVLSSRYYFGCSTLSVGKAPSPFKSNVSLCVFGYCYPFSTMASNIPAYEAIIVGLKVILMYSCS